VVLSLAEDSNVFYTSRSTGRPVRDRLFRFDPTVRATWPFRNSTLDLRYQASRLDYGTVRLERNWSQQLVAEVSLLFSSWDRLSASASRTKGVSETVLFDPGGEALFEGAPYDFDVQKVELKREVYGRRGYRFAAARSSLSFSPGARVSFFDYEGLDVNLDVREPISSRFWVTSAYLGRRYDHFRVSGSSLGPRFFRREESDHVLTGFQGLVRERSPFEVLVGRAVARFPGRGRSEFRGLVYDGRLQLALGGGAAVGVSVSRKVWPSFFGENDYYVSESLGGRFERQAPGRLLVGIAGTAWRNRYPRPVTFSGADSVLRRDRTWSVEAYATFLLRESYGLRLSVRHEDRQSSYEPADYEKTVVSGGIALGWL